MNPFVSVKHLYDDTYVFILRVWTEPGVPQGNDPLHRVAIEIVKTGEKYYLKDAAEIGDFITEFLEKSGTKIRMGYLKRIWWEIKRFWHSKFS